MDEELNIEKTSEMNSDEVKEADKPPKIVTAILKWLKYRTKPTRLIFLLFICILVIGLVGLSIYYGWFKWMKPLWDWGFNPLSFKCILSVWGCVLLAFLPLAPLTILESFIGDVINMNAEETENNFQNKLMELENKRVLYENKLTETDKHLLIPLITYSKIELETYYKIGLNQTQRSFKFSIISMWIGFVLIVAGIVIFIFPLPYVNDLYLKDTSLKTLTIASGIIVEMISVLFLWIYKNSMKQITYFYNRQVNIHNALFTFRIAETMNNADEAKKIIIEKILDKNNNQEH